MSSPGSPPKSPSSGRLIKSPSASARGMTLSGATLSGAHQTFESFGSRTSSIKTRSSSSSKAPSPNNEVNASVYGSAVTGSSALNSLHASASNLAVSVQAAALGASGSVASGSAVVSGSTRTGASHKSSTSSLKSRSSSLNRRTSPKNILSTVEEAMLRADEPIEVTETSAITVIGNYGVWVNREEVLNWRGDIPIENYQINEDPNPEIITKKSKQNIEYVQELAIRYLRPPTPPAPGEIVITQEPNFATGPAPPLIIRQQPPRPETPEPLVIREAPPEPPAPIGIKKITISGKQLPPPPRKVIIERLPALPPKPQAVLIERWLPYSQVKRRVIFNKAAENDPLIVKPRNIIVQWEAPHVQIKKEYKYLGVITANPEEYVQFYGNTLKTSTQLPDIVHEIPTPEGLTLAADYTPSSVPELEGDLHALKLIDLHAEGLSEYSDYVRGIKSVASSRASSVMKASANSRSSSIAQSASAGVLDSRGSSVAGSRTTSVASSAVNNSSSVNVSASVPVASNNVLNARSPSASRTTSVASSAVNNSSSVNVSASVPVASNTVLNARSPSASRTTSVASSAVRSQASVPIASRTTSVTSSAVVSSGVDTASAAAFGSGPSNYSRTTSTASTIQPRNSVGSTVVSAVTSSHVSSNLANLAANASSSRSASNAGSFYVTASLPSGSRTASQKSVSPTASVATSLPKSTSKSPVQSRTTTIASNGVKSVVSSVVQSNSSVAKSEPVANSRAPSVSASVSVPVVSSAASVPRAPSTVGSLASSKRKSSIGSLVQQIFHQINRNHSGGISIEDAEKALLRLNSRLGRRYGEDDVIAFFSALDKNQDGTLDFEEFKSAFENIVI